MQALSSPSHMIQPISMTLDRSKSMFARGDATLYPELPAQDEASYVIIPRPVVKKEKIYDKVPSLGVEDEKVYDKVPRQEREKFFSTNTRRKQVSISKKLQFLSYYISFFHNMSKGLVFESFENI